MARRTSTVAGGLSLLFLVAVAEANVLDAREPYVGDGAQPSCTGAAQAVDEPWHTQGGLYPRKIIAKDIIGNEKEGLFCYITVELCKGETSVTQGMDFGHGDYYRLQATSTWCDYTGNETYKYSGMHECEGSRAYSPVNPMNNNNAQFIVKQYRSDPEENGCTAGVDCKFGLSELLCEMPVGSEILMTAGPDHSALPTECSGKGTCSTHYAYKSNMDRQCGKGPYTINVIGQGIAITETHPLAMNALLESVMKDGCFSTVKVVNMLWANSYWSNAAWVFDDTKYDDLARSFIKDALKHGSRFKLMHSISREKHPEAQYPRTTVEILGQAFNLTNTTNQDPNVKWFVVGSGGYKAAIYSQIKQWGFDIKPCSEEAGRKGSPGCGPNSLYEWEVPGPDGLKNRQRSELFKYYDAMGADDEESA